MSGRTFTPGGRLARGFDQETIKYDLHQFTRLSRSFLASVKTFDQRDRMVFDATGEEEKLRF